MFFFSLEFIYSITITLELPYIKKTAWSFRERKSKELKYLWWKSVARRAKKNGPFFRFFVIFMHFKHFFQKIWVKQNPNLGLSQTAKKNPKRPSKIPRSGNTGDRSGNNSYKKRISWLGGKSAGGSCSQPAGLTRDHQPAKWHSFIVFDNGVPKFITTPFFWVRQKPEMYRNI